MAQPLAIIASAFRSIGAFGSGDAIGTAETNDAFYLLNEMLDQWSNDHLLVYSVQEVIQELTGGQYIYTIGPGGSVGASFTGSVSGTVLTVTALASGAISTGQVISGAGIATGSALTSLGSAFGGNGNNAIGTYNLSLSSAPTGSVSITSYQPRPLRINTAFVRVVNSITGTLDYNVAIWPYEQYQEIGIKTLPGPWPKIVSMLPTEPVASLYYFPNPSQGEMHLFVDTVLNNFATINDNIVLPQGYQGALHWGLAELLMPEYGKLEPSQIAMVTKHASAGRALVRRSNMHPQVPATYDDVLLQKTRKDAGWILHGGFV
jgi:hypothetical protein